MKINKASDLSSISVFPPRHVYSKKPNPVSSGLQASQNRSQMSQQSFSQGLSSQQMLSHFSQSSLDEAVTANDQRIGSQDHENSSRKLTSLPRLTYSKEDSQPPNTRSSSNLMVKWNSADYKNQLSEGLEHRIGIMETSLSRFAMILDSIQSDVMQVNKGTKEFILEMEYIRQKLIAQDNSLQLMAKGQEEIKANINGSLKSFSEQISQVTNKEQELYMIVSAMPQQIEASLRSVQNHLCDTMKEMQARKEISYSLENVNQKNLAQPTLYPKEISCSLENVNQKNLAQPTLYPKSVRKQITTPKMRQHPTNEAKISIQVTEAPKVETGGWRPVKKERNTFSDRISKKVQKQPCAEKFTRGGRDCAIVIESDEETNVGFSCLVKENAELPQTPFPRRRSSRDKQLPTHLTDYVCKPEMRKLRNLDLFGNLTKEDEEETERILRNARKRKRKYSNSIITIN